MFQVLRKHARNIFVNGSTKKILACQVNKAYSTLPRLREEDAEEVKIPMPWGHIAGKWWGRKDEPPMLGIHGWQDNAGSFDRLVPLLNVPSFLAIDLPGHGQSSHLPQGKVYTFLEYIITIRRIIDHFRWEKYSIMGHSLGSAIGFVHTSINPEEVKCFISLECARYLLLAYTVDYPMQIARGVKKILEYEKVTEEDIPSYTYQQAIEAVITGSLGSVTSQEAASILFKRGTTKTVNPTKQKPVKTSEALKNGKTDLEVFFRHELGETNVEKLEEFQKLMKNRHKSTSSNENNSDEMYKFTKDPRIKMIQFGLFNQELWNECSQNIQCPMLSVQASEGFLKFASEDLYKKGNEILREKSKYFEHQEVGGNHHSHLNTPENVAPAINNFLKNITLY